MLQTKIFSSIDTSTLERMVNKWLEKNNLIWGNVKAVQYSTNQAQAGSTKSVLIVYEV